MQCFRVLFVNLAISLASEFDGYSTLSYVSNRVWPKFPPRMMIPTPVVRRDHCGAPALASLFFPLHSRFNLVFIPPNRIRFFNSTLSLNRCGDHSKGTARETYMQAPVLSPICSIQVPCATWSYLYGYKMHTSTNRTFAFPVSGHNLRTLCCVEA
ncbi:hypothetical protein J3A83DRAFT_2162252 [Scleroderma citrinum]